MELKRYWQIMLRYWWVVVILTALGTYAAYDNYKANPTNYQASMQVNIQRQTFPIPTTNPDFFTFDNYYANISSEYAADDFTMVVRGSRFLGDVAVTLKDTAFPLAADEIKKLFELERKHREITFTFNTDSEAKSLTLAKAFGDTIEKNAGTYLELPGSSSRVFAKVLDMPLKANFTTARNLLASAIRAIVGLIIGIALAFLLAYLDDRLRTPREFKDALDLPVLGEIPAKPLFGGGKSNTNGTPPSIPVTPVSAEREKVKLS